MRYYGVIGFGLSVKDGPGIYKESISERKYYGDVNTYRSRRTSKDQLNDDIDTTTELSIVGDQYAFNTFKNIKYAEWIGEKWDVTSVRPLYPRLILTLGGLYHGQ